MNDSLFSNMYNPDVLSCLANLSNDEVFTPPEIANQMLDLLPQELFKSPDTKFLDPACKSGVFLREIAKRLIDGLEDTIPDLQERIDHIFHNQLYGIAITELTSLLTRRGLYCSKYPNSKYSVSKFDDAEGNIRYKRVNHKWKNGRCVYCGASQSEYDRDSDLETHAYELIHTFNPEEIFKMKFDVIIGNPPYQLNTSNIEGKANAIPLYQNFVMQAKKLSPKYLVMIIPSRWMTGGTGSLNQFRIDMINDERIAILHDFFESKSCFPGVEIKGGVCYFLWDSSHTGNTNIFTHLNEEVQHTNRRLTEENTDVFIRYGQLSSIREKVSKMNEPTLDIIASPQTPYGLLSNAFTTMPELFTNEKNDDDSYRVYGLGKNLKREIKFTTNKFKLSKEFGSKKYKLFISEVYGSGEIGELPPSPIIGVPGDICTQTFRQFGCFDKIDYAINLLAYSRTKFFRALVSIMKHTHHAPAKVYQFVPLQDFSKPWTDEELYKKYNLTQEEIDFIESMIKPMDMEDNNVNE